ncbi:hypothetical protein LGK97_15510 [Clostridium sp. CS001]|uniref:hypothetical protein n=1 Tax=Clostridium sp. CS001 TaxID=2880648 RepID=UPI001CF1A071|nr:hypothetical protein [Clostridium sp. CS001]MCB2291138.1 hypothetical protein [Clostridium sp. CS001]
MLYREMEEEEFMNMENEDLISPEQTPICESHMMEQQMYQNPTNNNPMMQCPMYQNLMMQNQIEPQPITQMHHIGCPMMNEMFNPSTYPTQIEMDEYGLEEGFNENMERSPYDGYYNNSYYPYNSYYQNSYYQNYYPFSNFNPLLIPLLLGRD